MLVENSLFKQDIPEKGIIDGHIRFKLADTGDETLGIVGFCASITGSMLFEQLEAQGTNIIFSLAENAVHVVARNQDDGLNLRWTPKELDGNRLDDIAARIVGALESGDEPERSTQQEEPGLSDAENDAYVKQLTRIP